MQQTLSSLDHRAVELVKIGAVQEASNVLETLDIKFSATLLQQLNPSESLVGKLNILRVIKPTSIAIARLWLPSASMRTTETCFTNNK